MIGPDFQLLGNRGGAAARRPRIASANDLTGLGRGNHLPGVNHFLGLIGANETREPLGAPKAGNDAEGDLGQADLRVRPHDPVMTAEGEFEPAAERRAVNRRDHRFRRGFDGVDDLGQQGRLQRLAEFADVGAGDEGAPGAGEHDSGNSAIVDEGAERIEQSGAHRLRQRVDGGIVDQHDGDVIMALNTDGGGHGHEGSWAVVELFGSRQAPRLIDSRGTLYQPCRLHDR